MKDKKTIAYKNEQIRNIAFNLRKLIKNVVMNKWSQLGRNQRNQSTNEYIQIEDERSSLYLMLEASICECSSCYQVDRDMIYNATLKEWYCTTCVEEYRTFYRKNKVFLEQGGFVEDFDESFHKTFL